MKIRTDFVTNSSSSSFIIAFRKNGENYFDKETLEKYPFLQDYDKLILNILQSNSDKSYDDKKIETIEELNDYIKQEYSWYLPRKTPYDYWSRNDEEITIEELLKIDDVKIIYEEYKKYIDEGYCIFCKTISNYETELEQSIENISKDNKNFIIIKKNE